MRLIDGDALRKKMYHEAFETDTDMQRWDSGCWIRYKMFENAIESEPTVDAVPVVRCKDCKHFAGEGMYCENDIIVQFDHFYCYYGERKTDEDLRKL